MEESSTPGELLCPPLPIDGEFKRHVRATCSFKVCKERISCSKWQEKFRQGKGQEIRHTVQSHLLHEIGEDENETGQSCQTEMGFVTPSAQHFLSFSISVLEVCQQW